jgi:CRISPR-associated endonuclease/helicase Cas3
LHEYGLKHFLRRAPGAQSRSVSNLTALAKNDRTTGEQRSLVGHSLDVAHCVHSMLSRGVARLRLASAAGVAFTDAHADRIAFIAGLHDMAKATNGFQDRINGRGCGSGHVAEAVASIRAYVPNLSDSILAAIRADLIKSWSDDPDALLYAVFCHHGEPVSERRIFGCLATTSQRWTPNGRYDPVEEVATLTSVLLVMFARATQTAPPFQVTPRFQHALAGLVMTADWMGSDTKFHPVFGPESRPQGASDLLDSTRWCGWHSGIASVELLGNSLGSSSYPDASAI